jgi:hypothetical protein
MVLRFRITKSAAKHGRGIVLGAKRCYRIAENPADEGTTAPRGLIFALSLDASKCGEYVSRPDLTNSRA